MGTKIFVNSSNPVRTWAVSSGFWLKTRGYSLIGAIYAGLAVLVRNRVPVSNFAILVSNRAYFFTLDLN